MPARNDSVDPRVGLGHGQRGSGGVDRLHAFGLARGMQGEAAGGRKAVQHAAPRVARRGQIIFALIQIYAGFLAMHQIGVELQPIHLNRNAIRNLTRQNHIFKRQAFEFADTRVITRQDSERSKQFSQTMRDQIACAIHPLVQRLHHQIGSIAIDDQAGEKIALRGNQTAGVGVFHHSLAMRDRGGQTAQKKRLVDRLWLIGKKAQRDLRRGAVMRHAQKAASRVDHFDRIARL